MLDTENAVRDRYAAAASDREAELCCPVDYDARYLKIIPQEVIDRDYGCGDPSKYVREGETVLDLGSGGGKICFIASQVVGATGRVIGVDINDPMLELARRSQVTVAEAVGYDNVTFRKGKIQDLAIDRDAVDAYLKRHPVVDEAGLQALESFTAEMRSHTPMIPDGSIDVVVSNCVLNLVENRLKEQLFAEIHRVLRPGGRAVISDIVSDQHVPLAMQNDPHLWSGCISGAFQEHDFLMAFQRAGFDTIEMPILQKEPWQTVQGIEFRSATVIAHKPVEIGDADHGDAVIYRGPMAQVTLAGDQTFMRGKRTRVNRSTLLTLVAPPYDQHFIGLMADRPPIDPNAQQDPGQNSDPKKPVGLSVIDRGDCGSEGCC